MGVRTEKFVGIIPKRNWHAAGHHAVPGSRQGGHSTAYAHLKQLYMQIPPGQRESDATSRITRATPADLFNTTIRGYYSRPTQAAASGWPVGWNNISQRLTGCLRCQASPGWGDNSRILLKAMAPESVSRLLSFRPGGFR